MKRLVLLLTIAFPTMIGISPDICAQEVGLKTNLLYWGTTTPNFAVEVALNQKTTFELHGGYNPFRFGSKDSNHKLQHWLIMPELRRWKREKFEGHFFGFHALFGSYNVGNVHLPLGILSGLKKSRYEGYGVGAGVSYGYQWRLSPRWNLETQFGFGYTYLNYERYECHRCGEFLERKHKHYIGPTKAGVSLIYLIKSPK